MRIITPRWRPLLTGDATSRPPCDDDQVDDDDDVPPPGQKVGLVVVGDGKCDGPESSTVQKASAVAPTKAVGVICWSLFLLLLLLLSPCSLFVFLLLLLLSLPLFHSLLHHMPQPCRRHRRRRQRPASVAPAWRSASAARRVVIHPRGTVVSAAHNR